MATDDEGIRAVRDVRELISAEFENDPEKLVQHYDELQEHKMKTRTAHELKIDRLYHYQSLEEVNYLVQVFTRKALYFSSPIGLNDPWDCRPCYNTSGLDDPDIYEHTVKWMLDSIRKRSTSFSTEKLMQHSRELRADRNSLESTITQISSDMTQMLQEHYRIYCLSKRSDSILMWAHYAHSCQGVCLEFSVDNELFCGALPVEYLQTYPELSVASTGIEACLRTLLAKSEDWAYEEEFRIVATEHPVKFPNVLTTKDGFLPLPPGALKAVIMGPLISEENQKFVRDLVKRFDWSVALKKAIPVPDKYELDITTVD